MDDKKTPAEVNGSPAAYEESDLDDHMRERGGTQADAVDMSRLGKKQELRREFQFFRCAEEGREKDVLRHLLTLRPSL